MTTTTKATVTNVNLGEIEIEGLMMPCGTYAISVRQANALINFARNDNASKFLKSALGENLTRVKTDRNVRQTNPEAVITLNQFERLLKVLDRKYQNEKAQEIRDDLVGLSLRQLFADAFGEKFDAEERDEWLKERMLSKVERNKFTEAVKDYYVNLGIYDPSSASTRQMFARLTNMTKASLGFPLTKNHRDFASQDDLRAYEHAEKSIAMRINRKNQEPEEAINWYVEEFLN